MSMIGNYWRITPEELEKLRADPSQVPSFLYDSPQPGDRYLDVDKSWHAIHFLLTGSVWEGDPPLGNAVLGGIPLGEVDVGYGPARARAPHEVQEVAEALQAISVEALMSRYDAGALQVADIYPQIWDEGETAWEYVGENYRALRDFFLMAGEAGDAMLVYVN